jgi:cytochrome c553
MKLPAYLLTAALLAASALSSVAQQAAAPAAPAAAGNAPAGTTNAPAAAAANGPAPSATPAAAAGPTAPTAGPARPDLGLGESRYTAICASCHGADGNSAVAANPKIAQQHPEYLVKQLQEFKSGKRPSPIMQAFAAQLTDADMRNISWWAASRPLKPGFAKDKELVSLGERIYRGGIADRQIAACAGCHSPNGAGIPAQYPRLSGQHADYTAAQLVAFREGKRPNSVQMMQISAKLNDREIRAVSDYIAGLR